MTNVFLDKEQSAPVGGTRNVFLDEGGAVQSAQAEPSPQNVFLDETLAAPPSPMDERAERERFIEDRHNRESLMKERLQYVIDNSKDDGERQQAEKWQRFFGNGNILDKDDEWMKRSEANVDSLYKKVVGRRGHLAKFRDALVRGFDNTAIMAAQAWLGLTDGDNPETQKTMRALQSVGREWEASRPKATGSVSDIKGAGDVLDFIGEAIGENLYRGAIGTTAAIASGGLAGALGAGAAGAGAAAIGGSSLSTLALNTGEAVQDQLDEGVPFSRGWALAQGAGYSVLDGALGVEAGLGKLAVKTGLRAAKDTAVAGLKEVGKMATKKGALKTLAKSVAGEALQEPAQSQVVGRLRRLGQTGSALRKGETVGEAWMEALDEAAGGAAAALGMGGGGAAISHANAKRIVGIHNRVVNAVKQDAAFNELPPEQQLLVARRLMNDCLLETSGVLSDEQKADLRTISADIDAELGRKDADKATKAANAVLRGFDLAYAKDDFDEAVKEAKESGEFASRVDWEVMRDSAQDIGEVPGGYRGTRYTDPVTGQSIVRRSDKDGHIVDFIVENRRGLKDSLTGDALHTKSLKKALEACADLDIYNQYRARKSEAKRQVIKEMFSRMYGERGANLVIADSVASMQDPEMRDKIARAGANAAYDAKNNTVYVLADRMKNLGQLYTDLAHERSHLDIAEHILGRSLEGGATDEEMARLEAGREARFAAAGRGDAEAGEEAVAEHASVEQVLKAIRDSNLSLPGAVADYVRLKISDDTGIAPSLISDEDVRDELRFLADGGYLGKKAGTRGTVEEDTEADAVADTQAESGAEAAAMTEAEKQRKQAEREAVAAKARGKAERKAAGEEAARVIAQDGGEESVPPIGAAKEERADRGAAMESALGAAGEEIGRGRERAAERRETEDAEKQRLAEEEAARKERVKERRGDVEAALDEAGAEIGGMAEKRRVVRERAEGIAEQNRREAEERNEAEREEEEAAALAEEERWRPAREAAAQREQDEYDQMMLELEESRSAKSERNEGKTTDETRNRPNEAPAQPAEASTEPESAAKKPRPVEKEPQGGETGGVVKPKAAQNRAEAPVEAPGARSTPETGNDTPAAQNAPEGVSRAAVAMSADDFVAAHSDVDEKGKRWAHRDILTQGEVAPPADAAPKKAKKVKAGDTAGVFRAVGRHASQDNTRKSLMSVHVEDGQLVATDGRRIIVVPAPEGVENGNYSAKNPTEKADLEYPRWQQVVPSLKKNKYTKVGEISNGDATHGRAAFADELRRKVERSRKGDAIGALLRIGDRYLNPQYVKEIVDTMFSLGADKVQVYTSPDYAPVVFKGRSERGEMTGVVMPLRLMGYGDAPSEKGTHVRLFSDGTRFKRSAESATPDRNEQRAFDVLLPNGEVVTLDKAYTRKQAQAYVDKGIDPRFKDGGTVFEQGDAALRDKAYRDWLKRYGIKDTEAHRAEWERKQAAAKAASADKVNGTQLSDVVRLASAIETNDEAVKTELAGQHFRLAKSSATLKDVGLTGDHFTIRAGVVLRHNGKDAAHNIAPMEWVEIADALSNRKPLLVETRNAENSSFRIWTRATIGGRPAIVGADVKNAGRELTVNSIATAFGAEGIHPKENRIVYPKSIEEMRSVLTRLNSGRYPASPSTPRSVANPGGEVKGEARVTPEQDAAYMDAVKRGDMETAQRMVREAAKNGIIRGDEHERKVQSVAKAFRRIAERQSAKKAKAGQIPVESQSRRANGENKESGSLGDGARGSVQELPEVVESAQIKFNNKHRTSLTVTDGAVDIADVRDLFEKLNTDADTASLAQKVFRVAEKLGTDFYFDSFDEDENELGGVENSGTVIYNTRAFSDPKVSSRRKAEILLHEAIHSVTSYAIDIANGQSKEFAGIPISQELRDAVEELETVYSETESFLRRRFATNYAQTASLPDAVANRLAGVDKDRATKYLRMAEFMAELSNADVRKELEKHSLWTRIVEGIRKVINSWIGLLDANIQNAGYDKTDKRENALKVSYKVLDKFLRNADTGSVLAANELVRRKNASPYYAGVRFKKTADGLSPEGQRQYDEVVRRYTNPDGTKKRGWMKAPNGKPTKLSERQWVQVRTPAFKKWFGDWENAVRRRLMENAKVAKVANGAFKKIGDMSVQQTASAMLKDPVVHKTEIGDITIDKRSAHDSLAHRYSQKKLDALVTIQRDFANAVYLGSERDFDGKDITNHYFAYPIAYGEDGERNLVFCRAREDMNANRLYVHEVFLESEVKNSGDALQAAAASSTRDASHTDASPAASPRGIALARIILNRLFTDKGVSKVVDENGEPMVVWHGSTWNPANEPNGAAVFRTGEGETGSGAHFGTLKAAEERGADRKNGNLTPVYLNIKNPLRVADTGYWTPGDIVAEVRKTEKDFPWLDNWDEITSELKRRGYDGMVYENAVEDEGSDSYIALDPNQIKSAVDNNGDFSGKNDDIRFKRGEEEYDPRGSVPNVRGGWTEQKILRYLKAHPSLHGVTMAARLISEFDTVEELKDHMFYHGTKNFVGSMQPSMTKSERWAQEHGGGGYGQRYWGISISKSKKIASNFGNPSPSVSIYPVVLAKGAKVIDRPDLIDAADVEDHIVELWNDGVDAVRLGDWKSDHSEQELLVLNPRAICNIGTADSYRYFKLGSDENPLDIKDDAHIARMLEAAKEYAEYSPVKRFGKPVRPSPFLENADGSLGKMKPMEVIEAEKAQYQKDLAAWQESEQGIAAAEYERKMRDDIRFKRTAPVDSPDALFGARASRKAHGLADLTAEESNLAYTDKELYAAGQRVSKDVPHMMGVVNDALTSDRALSLEDTFALTVFLRDRLDSLADVHAKMQSGNAASFAAEEEYLSAIVDKASRAVARNNTKLAGLRVARLGVALDTARDTEAWITEEVKSRRVAQGLPPEPSEADAAMIKQHAERLAKLNAENEALRKEIEELRRKATERTGEAAIEQSRRRARKDAPRVLSAERRAKAEKEFGTTLTDDDSAGFAELDGIFGKGAVFKGGSQSAALTPEMTAAFAKLAKGGFDRAEKMVLKQYPQAASAWREFRLRSEGVGAEELAKLAEPIAPRRRATTRNLAEAREETKRLLDENADDPREQRKAIGRYLRRYRDALINENPDIPTAELNERMAAEAAALTGTKHDAVAMLAVSAGVDGYDLETRTDIQRRIAKARHALSLFRQGKVNEAARESGILYDDEATALKDMEDTLKGLIKEKADEIDYLSTFSESNAEAVERVKRLKAELDEANDALRLMRKDVALAKKRGKYAEVLEKRLAEAQRRADALRGETESEAFRERKAAAEERVAELKAALSAAKRGEDALKRIQDRIAEYERRIADEDYDAQILRYQANDAALQSKLALARDRRNEARRRLEAERRKRSYREKGVVGKALYGLGGILGEMKGVVASFDLSSVLRQGGQLSWAHPFIAAKNLKETLKAWKSAEYADRLMAEIRSRPNWQYYEKAGIDFTDWGEGATNKEDVYLLNQYRKITNSRLLKKGVMASERAFSMFLNLMRADVFDAMAAGSTFGSAANMNDSQLKAMGRFINIASQRGAFEKGGKAANAIPFLNMFLWSPRNVASRFQFLGESARLLTGGAAYGDKTMRRLFAKELVRYIGGMSAAAMFLKAMAELFRDDDDPPNDMEFDPRSSDFLKVRFGNVRIDMTSGLTPIMVFASRMLSGETKNLRGQVRESNRYELVGRFLRQKFAPGASLVYDMGIAREDFERRDIDWTSLWEKDAEHISAYRYLFGSFMPLTGADLLEQALVGGIPKTFVTGFLSTLGANVQAFDPYNFKQMKGDYTYFRGLYDKATDPEEKRHLLEYHPMLKRRDRIEAALKRVRDLDKIRKVAEKNGQGRPDLDERIKEAKQRAVDVMAGLD